MHQLTAAPGLTDSSDGVSPMAQSTAAAAIDDGQWSKNSTSVAAVHSSAVSTLEVVGTACTAAQHQVYPGPQAQACSALLYYHASQPE